MEDLQSILLPGIDSKRPIIIAVPCPRNRLASAESQAGCCQH